MGTISLYMSIIRNVQGGRLMMKNMTRVEACHEERFYVSLFKLHFILFVISLNILCLRRDGNTIPLYF